MTRIRCGLLVAFQFALLLFAPSALSAQCKPGDPVGRFDGSATSTQAGKLDVTLNLICDNSAYTGTLNTPLGAYTVAAGSFEGNLLKLMLTLNGSVIKVEAAVTGSMVTGMFSTADDKGPLKLQRTGDAVPLNHQSSLTPQQWHEDLRFFADQLTKLHPDSFANTPKAKFDAAVADLDAKLDRLDADEVYVGLDHLANLIGDAHTYVEFPVEDANLPLDIARFDQVDRIVMVAPGYEQALGARILAVQDTPISRARELAAALTPVAETDGLRDLRVSEFLSIGMTLHGLDITPSRDSARYLLETEDGRQITITLKALHPSEEPHWLHAAASLPLSERSVSGSAACTFLRSASTLYCKVSMILQLEGPSKQMLALIHSEHPDKVVIDLRQNGGGDYNLGLQYLIRPLMDENSINRKGHLFVMIGPGTFSAAMSNAAQFRNMTNAILVGQKIGERPNSYQEPREFTLPNSRLIVRYSTRLYTFAPGGENLISPDQEISTSWADYKAGRDPVLEWVVHQK